MNDAQCGQIDVEFPLCRVDDAEQLVSCVLNRESGNAVVLPEYLCPYVVSRRSRSQHGVKAHILAMNGGIQCTVFCKTAAGGRVTTRHCFLRWCAIRARHHRV